MGWECLSQVQNVARKPQDDDARISSLAAPQKHKVLAPMMRLHDLLSEQMFRSGDVTLAKAFLKHDNSLQAIVEVERQIPNDE